jgi:mycothiol synthase
MIRHNEASLTMRAPTMDDLTMTAAFINTCAMADIGLTSDSVDSLHKEWTAPGLNLATDVRMLFAPMGDPVGYISVYDPAPHIYPNIWGCVHPDYRGNGIGNFLLDWAEDRARQAVALAPPDVQVCARFGTVSTNTAAAQLFTQRGCRLVRHFWRMVRDLDPVYAVPLPDWPDGITIRPYIPKLDDRFVYDLVQEAFRDHWGFTSEPFDQWMHWMTAGDNYDPSLWMLAVTTASGGNEIAGVVLGRPFEQTDPDMGWISVLAVDRQWRQRGLGLALLHYAFGEYHRRGMLRVGLAVDADSLTGATRLYERAGMRIQRQQDAYEKVLREGVDVSTTGLD